MTTTSLQNTTNGSKPNPRSNNQISRSLSVSKSSCGMSNGVSLVDHSRNSSSFSDSKHFVCSTCHKCVFNANHDNCITKFLKEVNSRAKVQSPKTRNNNKPVEPKSHTQKPGRKIVIGQRISLNKSSVVHEKPNTPRSCFRWIPTGRFFKLAGLRWRLQTTLQASFLKEKKGVCFSALYLQKKRNLLVFDHSHQHPLNFPMLVQSLSGSTYIRLHFNSLDQSKMAIAYAIFEGENSESNVINTVELGLSIETMRSYLKPLFDEYFNPPPCAVSPDPVAVAAPRPVDPVGSPLSTTIDQDVPSASTLPTNQEIQFQVTHQGVEE
ncbi:hypothetical protein Tco_0154687 [Tanacetum coccineum]